MKLKSIGLATGLLYGLATLSQVEASPSRNKLQEKIIEAYDAGNSSKIVKLCAVYHSEADSSEAIPPILTNILLTVLKDTDGRTTETICDYWQELMDSPFQQDILQKWKKAHIKESQLWTFNPVTSFKSIKISVSAQEKEKPFILDSAHYQWASEVRTITFEYFPTYVRFEGDWPNLDPKIRDRIKKKDSVTKLSMRERLSKSKEK